MAHTTFDRLAARLRALQAKTVANGCTQGEALAAAEKVAELLERHDLSLDDLQVRQAECVRRSYDMPRKRRLPLDECAGAVAIFCNCRTWREKDRDGTVHFVFFGLPSDAEAAQALMDVVETAIRSELGRYKRSAEYQSFRHQERHLANGSFALGMAASLADRLVAMKEEREARSAGERRGIVVLKAAVVESEFDRLGLELRTVEAPRRLISPEAYDAGESAADTVPIAPVKPAGRNRA